MKGWMDYDVKTAVVGGDTHNTQHTDTTQQQQVLVPFLSGPRHIESLNPI